MYLGTDASKYVTRRPVNNQGSEKSFEALVSAIQDCDLNHLRCHLGVDGKLTTEIPRLPTRVIDVGSIKPPRAPRLFISKGQKGKYASLSHCWGGQRWLATTSSTIYEMQDGFELDHIPRTYADAITVTRSLGLQYLWIDSFCIIQDDRDDWRAESQNMGNIYEQAYCNIAATGAEDGQTGFLKNRNPEYTLVRIPSSKAKRDYVYFSNQPNSDFNKSVSQAKINTRGWVLQERILSRRTIHFAKDQWYLECREHIISEDGWSHEIPAPSESTIPIGKILIKENDGANVLSDKSKEQQTPPTDVLWVQILRSYSNCQLTFVTDKIPALEGIAKRFYALIPHSYVFGHWLAVSKPLPLSLMWSAAEEGGATFPTEKRAPSWSCLKADGPIKFFDCPGGCGYTRIDKFMTQKDSTLPNDTSIVLRGKLRKANKLFPNGSGTAKKDTSFSISYMSKTSDGNFTTTLGHAKFDHGDEAPSEFTLLFTFGRDTERSKNAPAEYLALILQEVEDGSAASACPVYRRIGLALLNSQMFFYEIQFSSLRII